MAKSQKTTYTLSWIRSIEDVDADAWNVMAMPLETPFFEWEWLYDVESSGSTVAEAGWLPNHLIVRKNGELVAAAPLYLKGHSYGEFVFDHQFADLAFRLGIEYYPKLLGMSPFTPAIGYRFLVAPSEDEALLTEILIGEIDRFCESNNICGCHFLYVDPAWQPLAEQCGFSAWMHHSYIWENQGFQTFDDYLKVFNANQRRNIKRERKAVAKAGLEIATLTGDEIPQSLFPQMHRFYSDHCDRFGFWGSKYLKKAFFESLHHNYRHRVLFVAAYPEGTNRRPTAMSFCIHKGERLYGRYWGSSQDIDCLHFEACYYAPIEWGIERGVKTFDPGAGGRHKKRRGFPARPNHSLHRFYNDRLDKILTPYFQEFNRMEEREIQAIAEGIPFAKQQECKQEKLQEKLGFPPPQDCDAESDRAEE